LHGCFHCQLGGTFWCAGHSHKRQGCTVHLCIVDRCLHEPWHQARAHHCLPHSEQWDGGARAQANQGCLTCTWWGPSRHSHLTWVLMGLHAAPKEDSAVSSAELVTGSPFILPGQLLHMPDPPRVDVPPPPTRPAPYAAATSTLPAHLVQAEHSYMRVGDQQKPLGAHMLAHTWWSLRGPRLSSSRWARGRRSFLWTA
jgi:hypothetical protein